MNFNILFRAFNNIEYCSVETIDYDEFVVWVTFGRFNTQFAARYTRDDVSMSNLYDVVNSLVLDFNYLDTATDDEGWYLAQYLSNYLEEHLQIFSDDLEVLVRECTDNAEEISDSFYNFQARLGHEIDLLLSVIE